MLAHSTLAPGLARLGFGCANIAKLDDASALSVLETAYENGIRHFDTAPLYGWGRADGLLSGFIRNKRDQICLVSKTGIAPPGLFAKLTAKLTRKPPQPRFGMFAVEQVRASVDMSLQTLGTDYLDALLLHEIAPDDMTDGLALELETLMAAGKTRAIGLATTAEASAELVRRYPSLFRIVQVPIDSFYATPLPAKILHSVLGARLDAARAKLARDPELRREVEAQTGVDPDAPGALGSLLLREALAANPGVTLFSSTRSDGVRNNAHLKPLEESARACVQKLTRNAPDPSSGGAATRLASISGAILAIASLAGEAMAQPAPPEPFIERFATLDESRWRIADGWSNGEWTANDWRRSQLRLTPEGLAITLARARGGDKPFSSGELQTEDVYRYGYFETRMRVPRGSGLVTGFFTYARPSEASESWGEIDIEILGRDTRHVQFTYFVRGEDYPVTKRLGFDASAAQNIYGFEWTPNAIRWYVNGRLVHQQRALRGQLPQAPQRLYLHLWNTETLSDWLGPIRPWEGPFRLTVSCIAYAPAYEGRPLCTDT